MLPSFSMFRRDTGSATSYKSRKEDTYGVGIDETGNQELPSGQIQSLEISTVADLFQECVHISSRNWDTGRLDLFYRLDNAVLADVEKCVSEGFVGAPVDRGDDSARDKESHLTV